MKHQILWLLLSKWQNLEAKSKKKIYIFLGLFSVLTLVLGVFAVTLLMKIGGFLFDQTREIGQSALKVAPAIVQQELNVSEEVQKLSGLSVANCTERLQSLLAVSPWINAPLSETFQSIVKACLSTTEGKSSCGESGC